MSTKLNAGQEIPAIKVNTLSKKEFTFGELSEGVDWQMIVVYRGKHCPLCTKYLGQLKEMNEGFKNLKTEIIVVSADPENKAQDQAKSELDLPFTVGIDLTINQMKELGLYVSEPRSAKETDRAFAEPALFIINKKKQIQIIDISNAPFSRPDLESLHSGLKFISEKEYPIRGTHN